MASVFYIILALSKYSKGNTVEWDNDLSAFRWIGRDPREGWDSFKLRGERGIRTPGTLLRYTRFPGVPIKPLLHLSLYPLKRVKKQGRKVQK